AEDGIRCDLVTGVQTCALPICGVSTPPPGQRVAEFECGHVPVVGIGLKGFAERSLHRLWNVWAILPNRNRLAAQPRDHHLLSIEFGRAAVRERLRVRLVRRM